MRKKQLTKQQKRNARNRVKTLMNGIKDRVDIPHNYMVVGSFASKSDVSIDDYGKYDIDVDITFKGEDLNAHSTYIQFKNAISEVTRIDESVSHTTRVIRVNKETDFYIDIALVDYYSDPKRVVANKKGTYEWDNK